MNDVLIETPKGVGKLDNIYVSELGFLMVKIAVAFLAIFEKMDYFLFPHLATLFRFNEKWETFFVQIWHFFVGIVHQGRRRVETPTSRQRGKRRRSGRSLSALCR